MEFGQTPSSGNPGNHRCTAHLGPNPQGSFSSALSGSRRRSVFRSSPLDRGTQKLSISRQSPEPGLSWKVSRLLQQACDKGKIPAANNEIKASRQKELGRLCQKAFRLSQTVLDYLGRYTHRVALSNDRILQVQDGEVTLSYRDRRDGDRKKTKTLDAQEFIRRFLLHVLPEASCVSVTSAFWPTDPRNKPWLNAANSSISIRLCRQSPIHSAKDLLLKITGVDLSRCPSCPDGTMIVVGDLPASSSLPRWDSS